MKLDLSRIRHVVLDMDGTLYRGSRLFDCTLPFLARLERLGLGYTFLTNNTSRSKADCVEKFARFGIGTLPRRALRWRQSGGLEAVERAGRQAGSLGSPAA